MRYREAMTGRVVARLSAEEQRVISLAALNHDVTISEFVRQAAIKAARRVAA